MAKINLGSVVGPQGPQGPPGADGADGAQGIPGPNEISQDTSVVGITSGHFFYNDNGKVKGKNITTDDIVDGAKKQSEINNEFSSAIGQMAYQLISESEIDNMEPIAGLPVGGGDLGDATPIQPNEIDNILN